MKKSFVIGKYAYSGNKLGNKFTVEIELREKENGKPVFSASGMITGNNGIGCICWGQCLDEMRKYVEKDNTIFNIIYGLWKRNHLNDMNAGDEDQTKAVKEYTKNNPYDYGKVCEYLKEKGLYEHNNYKYGSAWLYRKISQDDLAVIKALLNN